MQMYFAPRSVRLLLSGTVSVQNGGFNEMGGAVVGEREKGISAPQLSVFFRSSWTSLTHNLEQAVTTYFEYPSLLLHPPLALLRICHTVINKNV